jgi:hypothetical protein
MEHMLVLPNASLALSLIMIAAQIGILILTILGVTIPLLMADPDKMIRTDGTRVVMPRLPSWKSEFHGLWVAIVTDPMILLLFPMFFASNYFYTWRASLLISTIQNT